MDYGIDTAICVTSGDCSNTVMLMEVLKLKGLKVIPFAYPDQPDSQRMQHDLEMLAETLGTTLEAAGRVRDKLKSCRRLALKLDELTWKEGVVSGGENHLWLVSTSDFNQDHHKYHGQLKELLATCLKRRQLKELLATCLKRQPYPQDMLKLAYIGVPSVYGKDLYRYLESNGARVVFNEIQRQFAMPRPGNSLAEQYSNYTYPYSIYHRLNDITSELGQRRVDGVIHYVQAFCHRGIGDIIFRDALKLPILTLEGNDDFFLTQHLKTRVEAFLDMLVRQRRHGRQARV
jgi:benzoyl-CoA reductase/2-hydroxyglutaryl-CoA dehydratase subunit BcrC/BadD/HgdB